MRMPTAQPQRCRALPGFALWLQLLSALPQALLTIAPQQSQTSNFSTVSLLQKQLDSTNLSPSASPQRPRSLAVGLNSSLASTLTSPLRPCSPVGPPPGLCRLASHVPVPQPGCSHRQPEQQLPDNMYVAPHVLKPRAQQGPQHSRARPEAQQVMTAVKVLLLSSAPVSPLNSVQLTVLPSAFRSGSRRPGTQPRSSTSASTSGVSLGISNTCRTGLGAHSSTYLCRSSSLHHSALCTWHR